MSKKTPLNESNLHLVITIKTEKNTTKILTIQEKTLPTFTTISTVTKPKNIPALLQQSTYPKRRSIDFEEIYDLEAIKKGLTEEIVKTMSNEMRCGTKTFFTNFFTQVNYYRLLSGHFPDLYSNLPNWCSDYASEFPPILKRILDMQFIDADNFKFQLTVDRIAVELHQYFYEKITSFSNQLTNNIINNLLTTRSIDSALILRAYKPDSKLKLYLLTWLKSLDREFQIEQAIDLYKVGKLREVYCKFGRANVVDELIRLLIRNTFSRKPSMEELKKLLCKIIEIYIKDRIYDMKTEIDWLIKSKLWFIPLFNMQVIDDNLYAIYKVTDFPIDDDHYKWIKVNENSNMDDRKNKEGMHLGLSKCLENISVSLKIKELATSLE